MRQLLILIFALGCGQSIEENTEQCQTQPGQVLSTWDVSVGWQGSTFAMLNQFCAKEGSAKLATPLSRIWLTKTLHQPGQTDFKSTFDTACRDGWLWIGDDPNDHDRQTRVPFSSVELSYHVRDADVTYYIGIEAGSAACSSVLLRNVDITF